MGKALRQLDEMQDLAAEDFVPDFQPDLGW